MNDKLLHYTWVHMLCLRGNNFAQPLNENIFMLWCNKNDILINRPHYVMQHMMKCRDNNMSLPYDILITRIMQMYDLDLSNDAVIMLELNHYFGKKYEEIKYIPGQWYLTTW